MEITSKVDGDVTRFQIAGRIDALTSADVESAVGTAIESGTQRIIFDMQEVDYVSSAGLRALLLAAKKTKEAGGGIAMFGLQAGVIEVFALAGFDRIIPIVENDEQAREKVGA